MPFKKPRAMILSDNQQFIVAVCIITHIVNILSFIKISQGLKDINLWYLCGCNNFSDPLFTDVGQMAKQNSGVTNDVNVIKLVEEK